MKIVYQGAETETAAADLAGFLQEKGWNAAELVIEFNGDVLPGGAGAFPELRPGDRIDVFRIVTGG